MVFCGELVNAWGKRKRMDLLVFISKLITSFTWDSMMSNRIVQWVEVNLDPVPFHYLNDSYLCGYQSPSVTTSENFTWDFLSLYCRYWIESCMPLWHQPSYQLRAVRQIGCTEDLLHKPHCRNKRLILRIPSCHGTNYKVGLQDRNLVDL
jgi:hypothetical protein